MAELSREDLARVLDVPAVACNSFAVSVTPQGVRLAFVDAASGYPIQVRAVVFMHPADFVSMLDSLAHLAAQFKLAESPANQRAN